VIEFLEKPTEEQVVTDEVNAGAYVLERSVIDAIPPNRMVSIEREIFPHLVGRGLYGHRLDGYWMDIGTPERYLQASWDILERRVQTSTGRGCWWRRLRTSIRTPASRLRRWWSPEPLSSVPLRLEAGR
jgi:NDP-sugar pyrophosphorylase family protein